MMQLRYFHLSAALSLLFILHCPSIAAQYANFANCTKTVRAVGQEACNLPGYVCTKDQPTKPQLTQAGCRSLCGVGFQIDEPQDIVARFLLWVLPAIILAAHFQFQPLGWKNTLAVVVSIVGNPVESLWAIMTRHEVVRRVHRRAVAAGVERDDALNLASIAAACDEFGWNDPLDLMFKRLTNRLPSAEVEPNESEEARASDEDAGEDQVAEDIPEATPNNEPTPTAEAPRDHLNGENPSATRRRENGERPDQQSANNNPSLGSLLDLEEICYLAKARQELVANRYDSQTGTSFAILGLLGAIVAAFVKVLVNREREFSTRTIPMVIMTFYLIPLVQLSGTIGAFTSVLGPLYALQKLQKRLEAEYDRKKRPENQRLSLPDLTEVERCPKIHWDTSRASSEVELDGEQNRSRGQAKSDLLAISNEWIAAAQYTGMNPTWRPSEHMKLSRGEVRSTRLLLVFSLCFVSISVSGAIIHSYCQIGLHGFGCRCLLWSLIGLAWLARFVIDHHPFQWKYPDARPNAQLWRWTVIKDSVVTFLVAGGIFVMHIGMTGTCYCESGRIFGGEMELTLTTFPTLILTCCLLGYILYDRSRGTIKTILCPSKDEREKITATLLEKEKKLEEKELKEKELEAAKTKVC